ncbi:hypothetical protein AB0M43_14600 [Longispora sp. NPDC051575]|uniref:restriction system modified-DNA reader domain-containing protein n=1 Tax=Longispora sp. NPDC051575 TaxID=3154943 RepID=UPI003435A68E
MSAARRLGFAVQTVTVTQAVYDNLEQRRTTAGITVDATLRELLGLPPASPDEAMPVGQRIRWREGTSLKPLLDAGMLSPGQELTWHRRRRAETHTAIVRSDGRIFVNGAACSTPGAAARHVTRSVGPTDGWAAWRTADGHTLRDLRIRLEVLRSLASGYEQN